MPAKAPALPRQRVEPGLYSWLRLDGGHWLQSAVFRLTPQDLPQARAGPRRAGDAG